MDFSRQSNSSYGKRKIGFNPSQGASKLSRKLFFKKGPMRADVPAKLSARAMDRAVGVALKRRMIIAPEQKYFEVVATTAVSTTSTVALLNAIPEGDTESARTGAKVKLTKMEFYATIRLATSANNDAGKISLFIQKQCNGVAALFSTAPSGGGNAPYNDSGTPNILLKNSLQENQFYIIKDIDYTLDAGFSGQQDSKVIRWEVPLSRVVEYNALNGGTIADIIHNAVYLGTVGYNAPGNDSTLISYSRIWYTDM